MVQKVVYNSKNPRIWAEMKGEKCVPMCVVSIHDRGAVFIPLNRT